MKTILRTFICLMLLSPTGTAFGQLDNYDTLVSQYLTAPPESGFMIFQTPNVIPPGGLFQVYKDSTGDTHNDMALVDNHTDNLVHYTHYKYKQTYKGLDVEGAGCIEHFDAQGSLSFVNAKLAVNLNINTKADIAPESIMTFFLDQMDSETEFAWNDQTYEERIKYEQNDPNATYYPTPELLIAIDNYKDVHYEIPANRYTLAYKLKVATINPFKITDYYLDANSGTIIKSREVGVKENGIAGAYGYGTNNAIDSKWFGFPHFHYRLVALDNGRNFETRKRTGTDPVISWSSCQVKHDNDDDWGNTYLTETSAHIFTGLAWNYYNTVFGRNGMDANGQFVEVRTQLELDEASLIYEPTLNPTPRLSFGKFGAFDYCWDPSIVAHEFTHGITEFTADLAYEFEPGALNESYSDIFGIVIQSRMLDNNTTDWIYGNHTSIPDPRSFIDPNAGGLHYTGVNNNGSYYATGQPDTYLGTHYYNGTNINVDQGGIHINSGVQNHWFYILANGASGTNDNGDYYNVPGVGMDDAAEIAYLALTSILQSSSQFTDSRMATIQAAIALFGECSQQHKSTVDAWYAVGIGDLNSCAPLSASESRGAINIYPNPTNSAFSVSTEGLDIKSDLYIFDINGQLVKTINASKHLKIDVSDLSGGIYIVKLNVNDKIIAKKLIIQTND